MSMRRKRDPLGTLLGDICPSLLKRHGSARCVEMVSLGSLPGCRKWCLSVRRTRKREPATFSDLPWRTIEAPRPRWSERNSSDVTGALDLAHRLSYIAGARDYVREGSGPPKSVYNDMVQAYEPVLKELVVVRASAFTTEVRWSPSHPAPLTLHTLSLFQR